MIRGTSRRDGGTLGKDVLLGGEPVVDIQPVGASASAVTKVGATLNLTADRLVDRRSV
jgi:hypothetical protein